MDSESHSGAYKGSVDYAVPLKTQIVSAADGIVIRVRDDSKKYGTDPTFGQAVNYITIEHSNGELSEYLHLAAGSAVVHVGDYVKMRQVVAKSGLSGWLYAPHLHFMVYRKIVASSDFQCLDIRFRSPRGRYPEGYCMD